MTEDPRAPLLIQGQSIPLGESREVNVHIARLHTRTAVEMPIRVFRAPEPGPKLLLTACMHGDELNGLEAIRRMIADKALLPARGTVIAMPILNIYGFLHHSRYLPDGRDLNRSFPGMKNGSLAAQMAHFLMQEVLPLVDCGIDFHAGGASRANFPQIRCSFEDPRGRELAEAFRPPFIAHSSFIDKSFRKEAHRRGKPIVVFEGGESLRFCENSVRIGIAGTRRVMRRLGMLPEGADLDAGPEPIVLPRALWVRARHSGLFHPGVENGRPVTKGQIIGTVTDPYGSFLREIKSPEDGYVIALNFSPTVNKGDAVVHLGLTAESRSTATDPGESIPGE